MYRRQPAKQLCSPQAEASTPVFQSDFAFNFGDLWPFVQAHGSQLSPPNASGINSNQVTLNNQAKGTPVAEYDSRPTPFRLFGIEPGRQALRSVLRRSAIGEVEAASVVEHAHSR